ncbi:MAG: MBL fold metallo-hydrolase [Chloroflexi bacterium]|nr:MBL fold metallo-hydrolase [Chloroflexota bacterium]
MQIVMLGTGTSHGVPTIDCMLDGYAHCPHRVCEKAATDPRYRRTRASILVLIDGQYLLIDTSQDFREQMLANHVPRIDAVLYTHGHADHIYGLADIRSYCHQQGGAIDAYGSPETLQTVRDCHNYVFRRPRYEGGGIPAIEAHALTDTGRVGGVEVTAIPVFHGPLSGCQGYRFGDTAYIPDVKVIPTESMGLLVGLDLFILNCLRVRPHASHLSLAESLDYATTLKPKRCLFTHMTHDIDFGMHQRGLPPWISFAYDGQIVESE